MCAASRPAGLRLHLGAQARAVPLFAACAACSPGLSCAHAGCNTKHVGSARTGQQTRVPTHWSARTWRWAARAQSRSHARASWRTLVRQANATRREPGKPCVRSPRSSALLGALVAAGKEGLQRRAHTLPRTRGPRMCMAMARTGMHMHARACVELAAHTHVRARWPPHPTFSSCSTSVATPMQYSVCACGNGGCYVSNVAT